MEMLTNQSEFNDQTEETNDFNSRLADILISIALNDDGDLDENKTQVEHTS